MEDKRKNELAVVIIATVAFGMFGKLLVRTPYVAFGDFSSSFFISIALWWIYNSILFYVARQMYVGKENKKYIIKSIVFGFLATFIKVVIDTCIDQTVVHQPNMLIFIVAVEISMILYIAGLYCFLFVKVGKRKIQKEKKGITALVAVFCSLLILYAGTIFYYMKQVNYAIERFGSLQSVQELGLDQAIWNLTTTLGRRSTTIGTIVYVGCFIIIWWILEKITVEE